MGKAQFDDVLVTGEALQKALKIRDKPYFEATISKKKLPGYEEDGWYVAKPNKSTARIRKDKVAYELLEDETWSLLAKLGFKELNQDREFKILCSNGGKRKIDILAKDNDCALIVECSCADVPGTRKNLLPLIDKIKSYRQEIIDATMNHFGRSTKLKYGWVIVTRNISWNQTALDAATSAGISVIRDSEVDYFTRLQKLIGTAARFQLLAHLFKGSAVKNLTVAVPATRGKMGGSTFYTLLVSPLQLLKIGYIAHKGSRGPESVDVYQRMLKPGRLKEIARYIDDGGRFPTNIVVNLQTERPLRFDIKQHIGDCQFGELHLPNRYASAWIIDGQHRLYGYALSSHLEDAIIPVLAFENLPSAGQKTLFIDINHKQVKVSKGLLIDLYSELHWDSPDPDDRLTSLCSKIVKVLESEKGEPLYGRIVIGEEAKTSTRCLTMATVATALRANNTIARVVSGAYIPGPLGNSDSQKALRRATEVLNLYLRDISAARAEVWNLGDAKGGYTCTNNAIVAFIRVLKEILDHLDRSGISIYVLPPDDLYEHVKPFALAMCGWLSQADAAEIANLRSKVGSIGQTFVTRHFLLKIHEAKREFNPPGLQDWLKSLDRDGTREAKTLLDEIQTTIYSYVLTKLKETFGEKSDAWWYQGVPEKVRLVCNERKEKELGQHQSWQYFDLIHYKDIALFHWSDLFQSAFSILGVSGKKEAQVNWLVKLNEIRKTVSHPERGYLNRDQVDFVKTVHAAVMKHMAHPEVNHAVGS